MPKNRIVLIWLPCVGLNVLGIATAIFVNQTFHDPYALSGSAPFIFLILAAILLRKNLEQSIALLFGSIVNLAIIIWSVYPSLISQDETPFLSAFMPFAELFILAIILLPLVFIAFGLRILRKEHDLFQKADSPKR